MLIPNIAIFPMYARINCYFILSNNWNKWQDIDVSIVNIAMKSQYNFMNHKQWYLEMPTKDNENNGNTFCLLLFQPASFHFLCVSLPLLPISFITFHCFCSHFLTFQPSFFSLKLLAFRWKKKYINKIDCFLSFISLRFLYLCIWGARSREPAKHLT